MKFRNTLVVPAASRGAIALHYEPRLGAMGRGVRLEVHGTIKVPSHTRLPRQPELEHADPRFEYRGPPWVPKVQYKSDLA